MKKLQLVDFKTNSSLRSEKTKDINEEILKKLLNDPSLKSVIHTDNDGVVSIGLNMGDGKIRVYDSKEFNISNYAVVETESKKKESDALIKELESLIRHKELICLFLGADVWIRKYNDIAININKMV
jgi:hypothetical protein